MKVKRLRLMSFVVQNNHLHRDACSFHIFVSIMSMFIIAFTSRHRVHSAYDKSDSEKSFPVSTSVILLIWFN